MSKTKGDIGRDFYKRGYEIDGKKIRKKCAAWRRDQTRGGTKGTNIGMRKRGGTYVRLKDDRRSGGEGVRGEG